MKKSRFSAEQIVAILTEAATKETKVDEICRKHGITEQTYYRWRRAYGGLQVSEAKRLRALEDENPRLKKQRANGIGDLLAGESRLHTLRCGLLNAIPPVRSGRNGADI
jgi:putative transposase